MGKREEVKKVGRRAALIGAAAGISVAAALGVVAADAAGYVPTPPYLTCWNDAESNLLTLEATLAPPTSATVSVDSNVTLAGTSSQPLDFAVASSIPGLTEPDVDAGPGTPSMATTDGVPTWSFESTKIAAAAHTVYWTASFSDAAIPSCAGLTPAIHTTKPRELTIAPQPVLTSTAPTEVETVSVVPAVRGERPARARLEIREAGCLVGRVRRPSRDRGGPLIVVAERPAAGQRVPAGTRISLKLGKSS